MTNDPATLPSLLIADDDPIVVSLLSRQLAGGFDVLAACHDGESAISLAHRHRPDVALIDVQMPPGGGKLALREIRSCAPATAIVMLSADESDGTVREMIAAGATAYVRKGASTDELTSTLRRAIEAHARLDRTSADTSA